MATSKQVRKLESTTQGEVLEVEMAVRDEDGKRIKSNYATKSELTAAQTALGSANDANTAAISGLTTRMSNAEDDISDNATAISNEVTARQNAISGEASARESAVSTLTTRISTEETTRSTAISTLTTRIAAEETNRANAISDVQDSVEEIERVAHGASRAFVISNQGVNGSANNEFGENYDSIQILTGLGNTPNIFMDIYCPPFSVTSNPNNNPIEISKAVLIPEGLTSSEKSSIKTAAGNDVELVEVRIGDVILVKEVNYPDRWVSGFDTTNKYVVFSKLETTKVNIDNLESAINTLSSTVGNASSGLVKKANDLETALNGKQNTLTFDNAPTANSNNPVKSGGIKSALDGKQNTLTFDSTPTANSSNPVTSGGVKSALDTMQANLHVQSTVIGSVSIND